jgi:hypothetical protein
VKKQLAEIATVLGAIDKKIDFLTKKIAKLDRTDKPEKDEKPHKSIRRAVKIEADVAAVSKSKSPTAGKRTPKKSKHNKGVEPVPAPANETGE